MENGNFKDVFGNPLTTGSYFIYTTSSTESCLRFGKVLGILDDKIKIITASKNSNNVWFIQRSILKVLWNIKSRTFVVPRQNLGIIAHFIDIYEQKGFGGLKHIDVGGLNDILWKF